MIKIVKAEPDKSVIREIICKSCGVTLSYVPNDIKNRKVSVSHYDGGSGTRAEYYIECPECKKDVSII